MSTEILEQPLELEMPDTTDRHVDRPRQGDKAITEDLMARLRRHYIKPGKGLAGGVFVPECGLNGGDGPRRRCDALFVGFTSTSGRLLVGHEVKASRADWLHELDQLAKATVWADECHEWWIVAAPGVVHLDELPPGWGLMEPGRSRTRMTIREAAYRYPERTPSWLVTRSILARLDTLQRGQIIVEHQAAQQAAREETARAAEQWKDKVMTVEQQQRLRILERMEERLGVTITDFATNLDNGRASVQDLLAAAQLISDGDRLTTWHNAGITQNVAQLRETVEMLERVNANVQQLVDGERR